MLRRRPQFKPITPLGICAAAITPAGIAEVPSTDQSQCNPEVSSNAEGSPLAVLRLRSKFKRITPLGICASAITTPRMSESPSTDQSQCSPDVTSTLVPRLPITSPSCQEDSDAGDRLACAKDVCAPRTSPTSPPLVAASPLARHRRMRVFTLNRGATVYSEDAIVLPDRATSAMSSATSSQCTSPVRSPSKADTTLMNVPGRGALPVSSSITLAEASRRPKRPLRGTPAWSLRYGEFVGSVYEDEAETEIAAGSPKAKQANRALTTATSCGDVCPSDSVYLAKNGRDRRLMKQDALAKARTSRLVARRPAITAFGQSKLQVSVAVQRLTKERPEHMRKLAKSVEMRNGKGGLPTFDTKALAQEEVQKFADKSGVDESEIQHLYTAFTRYDIDDNGYLDGTEARQVLADLGLQPRTREEKIEVHDILCDQDVDGHMKYTFCSFLVLVRVTRDRLLQIQRAECMRLFDEADLDGNASLDADEVKVILTKRLGLGPRSEDETIELNNIFNTCDFSSDGSLCFEEFEEFVQRARAKLLMMRRDEEQTIAKAFQLDNSVVFEFRMDLPLLWDIFNRYDHKSQARIARDDLINVLMDFGLLPGTSPPGDAKLDVVRSAINTYGQAENTFPAFMTILHEARKACKSLMNQELRMQFLKYDFEKDGILSMNEIYRILDDFSMLPRTPEEQQSIVSVIERLDADGSGTFSFQEFEDFVQRLTEHTNFIKREREHKAVFALGYGELQLQVLRSTFNSCSPNCEGNIRQIGLVSAVAGIRDTLQCGHIDDVHIRTVARTAQLAPDRGIDFIEFCQSMRPIMLTKRDDHFLDVRRSTPHDDEGAHSGSYEEQLVDGQEDAVRQFSSCGSSSRRLHKSSTLLSAHG